MSAAAVVAVTAALDALPLRDRPLTAALAFLLVVLVASVAWGFRYAYLVSVLAALAFSWLAPPVHRFWISDPREFIAGATFLVVGVIGSHLAARARGSERELRAAFETMPVMAWTTLPDGTGIFVNRRWAEYTGLSDGETPLGWHNVVHPEDRGRAEEKWREALATGAPLENEVRFRRAADGEYRRFLVRGVPLRDERGLVRRWYGVLTDIEDLRQAEEARERLHQLQADMARVNRVTTMGELTASLAHEVNQPIAAAVTNANACVRWLIRDQPELGEARAAAKRTVADATRAAEIITRIRALFKNGSPRREPVDVNALIAEIVVLVRREAARSGVSIHTELAAGLPAVIGDRVQLQQVLLNLMMNGIEATKEVDGRREITVTSRLHDGVQPQVSVADTGVGLPPNADGIFNAFFTTKREGTGMGLAISRSIVESHGGRLWATPNEDRGATFHFRLPTVS